MTAHPSDSSPSSGTTRRRRWVAIVFVLAIAVVAVPAAARKHRPAPAPAPLIVNGLKTQDFPTTGALLQKGRNVCTGTLIGCETFLTAAHCVTVTKCVGGPKAGEECEEDSDCSPGSCSLLQVLPEMDFQVFLQHAGLFEVTNIAVQLVGPQAYNPMTNVGDVAVLKIQGQNPPTPAGPVTSIVPSPIDTVGLARCVDGTNNGTPCNDDGQCTGGGKCASDPSRTVAGFGITAGGNSDKGIKRFGDIRMIAPCSNGDDTNFICWDFDNPLGPAGTNSNTCGGDSGGPLFIGSGCAKPVVGVTSFGNATCLPLDNAKDARVATFQTIIKTAGGADLDSMMCGMNSHVEDGTTIVRPFAGRLDKSDATADEDEAEVSFFVPPGAVGLRVALNARDYCFRSGKCIKGTNDGTTCSDGAQCTGGGWCTYEICTNGTNDGTPCGVGECINGSNDGTGCIDNTDCTGGGMCTLKVCANGANDGTACVDDGQCTGGGSCGDICTGDGTCEWVCESGLCIGGTNDGTACAVDGQCTGGGVCYGPSNFDLYVRRGAAATPTQFDCKGDGPNAFEYCEEANPIPGTWHALVKLVRGEGDYQLTVTIIFPKPLKHFRCYEIRPKPQFTPVMNVSLVDQFNPDPLNPLIVDVTKPDRVCAPASKNDEDCGAKADPEHLTYYRTRRKTPFTRVRDYVVTDQFSQSTPLRLDILKPLGILVPTAKGLDASPPLISPGGAFLDHFTCYKVRRSKGAPKFARNLGVVLEDQFGRWTGVDLIRPNRLCAPVNKLGENPDAPNHEGHLVCYLTRGRGRLDYLPVYLDNQFGPQQYRLLNSKETCLPAVKKLPGWLGTKEMPTPTPGHDGIQYWHDTDGVNPLVAGCHHPFDGTQMDVVNGVMCSGNPVAGVFGEACEDDDVLVETNPAANKCHVHPDGIGHPDRFSCAAFCKGTQGVRVTGKCVTVPDHCGAGVHSARCECT